MSGYGQVNVGAIMDDSQGKFFKVPPGAGGVKVFLCPPRQDAGNLPYQKVAMHYDLRTDGPVPCLANFGEACPACIANTTFYAMKNDAIAQALSKSLYARHMWLYNCIPYLKYKRDVWEYDGEGSPKVMPFSVGQKLHKAILQAVSIYQNIFDPNSPGILHLAKEQGAKEAKFASTMANVMPERKPLAKELLDLLNDMPILHTMYTKVDAAEIQNLVDMKVSLSRSSGTMVTTPDSKPEPNAVPDVPAYTPPANAEPKAPTIASAPTPQAQQVAGPVSPPDDLEILEQQCKMKAEAEIKN